VWQIPEGKSLGQAQQDPANRLASLSIMEEITPDSPFMTKLQVQDGGAWQVLIDLDGDGQTDVDLTSDMEKPYDVSLLGDVDESSGLIITASPAGGVKTPKVGKTHIPISFMESPSELIGVPRNRRPIKLVNRHASQVSPATIEGGSWAGDMEITVEPNVAFSHFTNGKFFAEVPLSPNGDTVYTVNQSGSPATQHKGAIQWMLTNLYEDGEITIRRGDSLLLASYDGYPDGSQIHIDVFGDQSDVRSGSDEDTFVVTYNELGVYRARSYIDSNLNYIFDHEDYEIGSYTVRVVEYDLPDYIPLEVGFTRDLFLLGGPRILAPDGQGLDLVQIESLEAMVYLQVTANDSNEPVIEARMGSADGPLLDAQSIATFSLEELTGSVIPVRETYPDGSKVLAGTLRMTPARPNLDIRLQIFVNGAAFDNGGLSKWVSSDDFVVDPSSPDGAGYLDFDIIKSREAPTGPCHNHKIFHLGTQVGGSK
jgi:hypothetical protein